MSSLPQSLLIVEEDNPLRDQLVNQLQANSIEVFVAENASAALQVLQNEKIDLLLLAGKLPPQETFDIMMNVRRNKAHRDLPLILTSSYYFSPGFDEMIRRFRNAKYVVRPAPFQEILDVMAELLGAVTEFTPKKDL